MAGTPHTTDTRTSGNAEPRYFTLLDFAFMISGSWVIPFAVIATRGRDSGWLIAAFPLGGAVGFVWAACCDQVLRIVCQTLFGKPTETPPFIRGMCVYLGVLALSVCLQYVLYLSLCFALNLAFGATVQL